MRMIVESRLGSIDKTRTRKGGFSNKKEEIWFCPKMELKIEETIQVFGMKEKRLKRKI